MPVTAAILNSVATKPPAAAWADIAAHLRDEFFAPIAESGAESEVVRRDRGLEELDNVISGSACMSSICTVFPSPSTRPAIKPRSGLAGSGVKHRRHLRKPHLRSNPRKASRQASAGLYLSILLRTIPKVLAGRGSY